MGWLRGRREEDDPFRELRTQPGYDSPTSTPVGERSVPEPYGDVEEVGLSPAGDVASANRRPSSGTAAAMLVAGLVCVGLVVGVAQSVVSKVEGVADDVKELVATEGEPADAPQPLSPIRLRRVPGPALGRSLLTQPGLHAALRILERGRHRYGGEAIMTVMTSPERVTITTIDPTGDARVRTITRGRELQTLPAGQAPYDLGRSLVSIDTGAPARLVRSVHARSDAAGGGRVGSVVLARTGTGDPVWTLTLTGVPPRQRTWIADEHGRGARRG